MVNAALTSRGPGKIVGNGGASGRTVRQGCPADANGRLLWRAGWGIR